MACAGEPMCLDPYRMGFLSSLDNLPPGPRAVFPSEGEIVLGPGVINFPEGVFYQFVKVKGSDLDCLGQFFVPTFVAGIPIQGELEGGKQDRLADDTHPDFAFLRVATGPGNGELEAFTIRTAVQNVSTIALRHTYNQRDRFFGVHGQFWREVFGVVPARLYILARNISPIQPAIRSPPKGAKVEIIVAIEKGPPNRLMIATARARW